MTVCVATMTKSGLIVGAADRMLTRGTTTTEPPVTKIQHPRHAPHVSVMWAGSSTMQPELMQAVRAAFLLAPDRYPTVQSYAELCADRLADAVRKRADRAIFKRLPFGSDVLLSKETPEHLSSLLVDMMVSYPIAEEEQLELLIVGHDPDGSPHVWRLQNTSAACHDHEGFAAIGIGVEHADAQLRFARYTKQFDDPAATVLTYFAKRRAENAPSVGRDTDMFVRFPEFGAHRVLPEDMERFRASYEKYVADEQIALAGAVVAGLQTIEEMAKRPTPPSGPLSPPPASPDTSTHDPSDPQP